MDTERTLTEGVDIINSVADVPGVTFGLHICKGNYEQRKLELVAEVAPQGLVTR